MEFLLITVIFLINAWLLIFWLKEMLRQKSEELLKNKFLKKYFGKILTRISKLKKFQYKKIEDLNSPHIKANKIMPERIDSDKKLEFLERGLELKKNNSNKEELNNVVEVNLDMFKNSSSDLFLKKNDKILLNQRESIDGLKINQDNKNNENDIDLKIINITKKSIEIEESPIMNFNQSKENFFEDKDQVIEIQKDQDFKETFNQKDNKNANKNDKFFDSFEKDEERKSEEQKSFLIKNMKSSDDIFIEKK